jgi:hypothetical protein
MRDPELLVQDILEDKIAIKDLTNDELDVVVEQLVDVAEGLLDTEDHEIGVAMLDALDVAIEARVTNEDFEQAIVAAEARGSVYFEFEEYTLH